MKINYINLTVTNAQDVRRFFDKFFGLVAMPKTTDDSKFVGMVDEDGFVLTLMQSKLGTEADYPPTFHIGFLNLGVEKTNQIFQDLKSDGYDVNPPGFYHGEELYFLTPFGFTIQVS
jgi:lactoylglutathione lyase